MNDLLEKYIEEITTIKKHRFSKKIRSEHSINAYKNDIKRFAEFIGKDLTKATPDDMDQFLKLDSPSTAARRLMSLNNFYKFLVAEGTVQSSPIVRGETFNKLREQPQRMAVHMTVDEGLRFLEQSRKNLKQHAMMMTFLNTGVRESELCNLKRRNYDGESIKFIAKRDKERLIPLNTAAREVLDNYLSTRQDDIEYLFISNWNKQYDPSTIYKLVKKITQDTGIKKDITPHCLRHTFAAMMWEQGKDPVEIMYILGHDDIKTTMIYLGRLGFRKAKTIMEDSPFNVNLRKQVDE
jgi:integrase/recombinase XerD